MTAISHNIELSETCKRLENISTQRSKLDQDYSLAINWLPKAERELSEFLRNPKVTAHYGGQYAEVKPTPLQHKQQLEKLEAEHVRAKALYDEVVPKYDALKIEHEEVMHTIRELESNPPTVNSQEVKKAEELIESLKAEMQTLTDKLDDLQTGDTETLKADVTRYESAHDEVVALSLMGKAKQADVKTALDDLEKAKAALKKAQTDDSKVQSARRGLVQMIERKKAELDTANNNLLILTGLHLETLDGDLAAKINKHLDGINQCFAKIRQNENRRYEIGAPTKLEYAQLKISGLSAYGIDTRTLEV